MQHGVLIMVLVLNFQLTHNFKNSVFLMLKQADKLKQAKVCMFCWVLISLFQNARRLNLDSAHGYHNAELTWEFYCKHSDINIELKVCYLKA